MKFFYKKFITSKNGFAIIEVLIASAIISITIFAVMSAAQRGIVLSFSSLKNTQANYLLEEGAEAIKIIRDNDRNNLASPALNVPLYLAFNAYQNTWSLVNQSLNPNPVEIIDGVFTRKIVFSEVYRDSNDDIAAVGYLDSRSKKVEVTVSWIEKGATKSKSLGFYIFDIFN